MGIFFVGMFWMLLGALVDGFGAEINHQWEVGTFHVSQQKMDTYDTLVNVFWSKLPIIFLIAFVILGVIIALRDAPGEAY
jgi:hypothetical protein